ncbi:MAG: hypothetical protein ACOYEP_00515 [Limnochordia bacterium]
MFVHRDYVVAGSKEVNGLHFLPIVEICSGMTSRSCVGTVRPVGFAVLSDKAGYWLVDPLLLQDLAQAVQSRMF